MKKNIVTISIKSLSEYIELFEEFDFFSNTVLFRGQSHDWKLLPKLARVKLKKNISKCEKQMYSHFIYEQKYSIYSNQVDVSSIAEAQHHGLFTRLLDFTTNPLIALWFSVKDPISDNKTPIVYLLQPKQKYILFDENSGIKDTFWGYEDCEEFTMPHFFQPNSQDKRIISQSSWMAITPLNPGKTKFKTLTNFPSIYMSGLKIKINKKYVESIRIILSNLGYNHENLYQDKDGLCRDINDLFLKFENKP